MATPRVANPTPRNLRGAGRKKGIPNKRSSSVANRLEELNFDLLGELLTAAAGITDPTTRFRCLVQIAPYVWAVRKVAEEDMPTQMQQASQNNVTVNLTTEALLKAAESSDES